MVDLKGSSQHAAEHKHGVQPGEQGTVDKTLLLRVAELEVRLANLETLHPELFVEQQ